MWQESIIQLPTLLFYKGSHTGSADPLTLQTFPEDRQKNPAYAVLTFPAVLLRNKPQLQALPQAVAPLASLQRRLIFTNHTRTARSKRNGRELKINGITQNICLRTLRGKKKALRCLIKVEVIKATNLRCTNAIPSTLLLLKTKQNTKPTNQNKNTPNISMVKLACLNPVFELALNPKQSPVLTHTEKILINKGRCHGNPEFAFFFAVLDSGEKKKERKKLFSSRSLQSNCN